MRKAEEERKEYTYEVALKYILLSAIKVDPDNSKTHTYLSNHIESFEKMKCFNLAIPFSRT